MENLALKKEDESVEVVQLKIKPESFGIDVSMTKGIASKVVTIRKERDILAKTYLEVMQMDINDTKTAKLARETRLLIRDNRTKGFEASRIADKEVPLRLGQFIDSLYNSEKAENIRMEEGLEKIEKHQESLLKQAKEELQKSRAAMVEPYIQDGVAIPDLSVMDEEVFEAYLATKKASFEARVVAEKRAEDERIEQERIKALHNERFELLLPYWVFVDDKNANFGILTKEEFDYFLDSKKTKLSQYEKEQEEIREENEKLKKEAQEKEAILEAERKLAQDKLDEQKRQAQILADKQQKEKDSIESQLKEEREARALEIAQKQAEKDAEELRMQELSRLGDKAVLLNWIESVFKDISIPAGLSKGGEEKSLEIKQKFDSFRGWAAKQIEN